jgi:hypothetical protein
MAIEEGQPEETWRWGLLVGSTLRAPEAFRPLGLEVVDVEVIPNFSGAADRIAAWLIFESMAEASAAKARSDEIQTFARGLLAAAGFPIAALGSFATYVTSKPEIDAAGGRFAFFR